MSATIPMPGLARAMNRRGLSQSELARRSGVPAQTVSRVVRDLRASADIYRAITKALGEIEPLPAADEVLAS